MDFGADGDVTLGLTLTRLSSIEVIEKIASKFLKYIDCCKLVSRIFGRILCLEIRPTLLKSSWSFHSGENLEEPYERFQDLLISKGKHQSFDQMKLVWHFSMILQFLFIASRTSPSWLCAPIWMSIISSTWRPPWSPLSISECQLLDKIALWRPQNRQIGDVAHAR